MVYSFLDVAKDVLRKADKPLTYQEVWQKAVEMGITKKLRTVGKTPWQTLGAQMYVDVRNNESSALIKIGTRPARFFLKEREREIKIAIGGDEDENGHKTATYKECDLHPVLTYFAYATPAFNRGRAIFTKTIRHEIAKKKGYSGWNYPDIVGFSVPLEDWESDVIAFNELTERNALTLFSFEIKKRISKSTYREYYFQAVSNSSWAHQGYLVAAEIAEDDDLLAELDRLASSFGIGIIHLNLDDMSESRVVYPAQVRSSLDWETVNKLCEQNSDFQKFLQNVKIDVNGKKIHRSEYDEVITEIDEYLEKLLRRERK